MVDSPLTRLLILGIDAGAPQLFAQWTRSGDMPNLARLWQDSAWGRVENPPGLEAGAVWPVFHSGLLPGHQPQYDGRRWFDPTDYSVRWYTHEQTPPTFWRQLSDQGLRCLLIDPPYVHLDPEINGSMVVDWGSHVPANGRAFAFQTHPPSLAQEILDQVGPDPAGGRSCDRMAPESIEEHRAFAARYLDRVRKKAKLTRHLLAKGNWDLVLAAFMDLHCAGHHLWHINDKGHPKYRPEVEKALGEPLRECYRAFDQGLGEILADVDDRTMVLLFGSHGMGPQYTGTGLLDRILLALDRGTPARRPQSAKASLRALWHQVPVEWRARLKTLRKPFSRALHPPRFLGNEAHRRYFEVYANNASGGVRINLKGREAHGLVEPHEYRPLLEYLRDQLRQIVNVETGAPLIEDAIISRTIYDGPSVDALPDLLVRWNRATPIRRVRSDAIGTLVQESADGRTGDHTPDGIFIARGPGISARGDVGPVRAADFAPTIAARFGRTLGQTDGRPITPLVAHPDAGTGA